ncbi:hypothetical protein ACN47E_004188 [Coniothyrium glycines]
MSCSSSTNRGPSNTGPSIPLIQLGSSSDSILARHRGRTTPEQRAHSRSNRSRARLSSNPPVSSNPAAQATVHPTNPSRVDSAESRTERDGGSLVESFDENKLAVPQTNLTIFDVAALILNKQIGTGIFTTPGAVLLTTKSKGLSIGLWTIGGAWTLLFLLVYLEYGSALPYNGGELVYLDEIFHRPELFATILFSGFFLTLANSYGNATQFAKHVLLAARPDITESSQLDPRLIRFVAVTVITLVCGIHWFSSRSGLFLNKLVAWYKTILLIVVFACGMKYADVHGSEWTDSVDRGGVKDGMAGMVLIFYSYQGWENANYVAGEIRAFDGTASKRILNIGAFLGVGTVWILYVLVTLALYNVLDYDTLTGPNSDLTAALKFGPRVFGNATALKICMAISAFGNVLAVTYTASKVKQSIAVQRILPFWHYLQADQKTPKGALFLHWITNIVFIAAAPTSSDGYSFAIGLYAYGNIICSTIVALGLPRLEKQMKTNPKNPNFKLTFFKYKWLLYTLPYVFAAGNILILVFAGKTHISGKIPRLWWFITIVAILFVSALYWGVIQLLMKPRGGQNLDDTPKTWGDLVGIKLVIYKNADSEDVPEEVRNDINDAWFMRVDGSKRRVHAVFTGRMAQAGASVTRVRNFIAEWIF